MYRNLICNTNDISNRLDALIAQNGKTFSNDALIAFLGGFSGAFFAFLFDRLANFISKRRERYIKHKNALVRMEYLLVKHQDRVNRLIYLMEETIAILQKPAFTNNRFPALNSLDDLELDMADINVINDVANYWLSVERVNDDCSSLNRVLDTLQQISLSGAMPDSRNFEHLINLMSSLKDYLSEIFLEENVTLNAYIRQLLKIDRETPGYKRFIQLYSIREIEIPKKEIEAVKKIIKKEMKDREESDTEKLMRKRTK